MNPPLSFTDAQTQLALLTSQTANFTFTNDELAQALQIAYNDTFVGIITTDDSITLQSGVWEYQVPGTMDVVREIYYRPTISEPRKLITKDLYDIIDGSIQFKHEARQWLDSPYNLHIKGWAKLTTDDDLPTVELCNYTIYLAAEYLINTLIFRKTFQFLRTDITMADIARGLQTVQAQVLRYKQALLREFESN